MGKCVCQKRLCWSVLGSWDKCVCHNLLTVGSCWHDLTGVVPKRVIVRVMGKDSVGALQLRLFTVSNYIFVAPGVIAQ